MPILNYTTTISPAKTFGEVSELLARAGAGRVAAEYADGEPVGVTFTMTTEYGVREFELPVRADGVLAVLTRQRQKNSRVQATHEQAARVAWRIALDWLEAQVALIESGLSTADEVLLPYMLGNDGRTVYSVFRRQQLELEGKNR